MNHIEKKFIESTWFALKGKPADLTLLSLCGEPQGLSSKYEVSSFAASAVAIANLSVATLLNEKMERPIFSKVEVSRTHACASFICDRLATPIDWKFDQDPFDVSGNYKTKDGWIRIHTMYHHHLSAVLQALGCNANRAIVADMISQWKSSDLEMEIANKGGAAAMLRRPEEWSSHPHSQFVDTELLFRYSSSNLTRGESPFLERPFLRDRPLEGLRVLDLTRVLAGPIGARFLASYGADVIRVDPPGFIESNQLLIETTRGKRTVGIDLRDTTGRKQFEDLLRSADVLIHGYRTDAMERLGYGLNDIHKMNPHLVTVRHNAYGWSGPLNGRRGFDSLIQMNTGIAFDIEHSAPKPLPAQALDYATGYLIASAALKGLTSKYVETKLSLVRVAQLLISLGQDGDTNMKPFQLNDEYFTHEKSFWGLAKQLRCPGMIDDVTPHWIGGATVIGQAGQINWLA
ncbi:MAG: CoA transferase [Proteobacteria bacterium]|nr:CoA transferase [Pseudomonadota bacterium]